MDGVVMCSRTGIMPQAKRRKKKPLNRTIQLFLLVLNLPILHTHTHSSIISTHEQSSLTTLPSISPIPFYIINLDFSSETLLTFTVNFFLFIFVIVFVFLLTLFCLVTF